MSLEEEKGESQTTGVEGEEMIKTSSKPNFIISIPQEVLMEVFKWLDTRSFLCVSPFVCKEWYEIIHSERWRK